MHYRLGDIEQHDPDRWDRQPIYRGGAFAGHPRWHGLMVRPQREAATVAWLELRGVYAFYPVTAKRRIVRGKPLEYESKYLPGYVFARFPGRAIINRVMACPFISGALTVESGAWGIIRPLDMRKLHAMRSTDAQQQEQKAQAAKIQKGDRVKVLEGLWQEGQTVEVIEVRAGKARFKIHMFGADIEAEADVDRLRKIG